MPRTRPRPASLLPVAILSASLATAASAQVLVVNMIPNARSNEANQDSEPNLTPNPANPQLIVGSAFTPDPMNGSNAPVYCSSDGGNTWVLTSVVPGNSTLTGTGDITPRFGGTSNVLYGGTLRGGSFLRLNLLRSNGYTCATTTAMTTLVDRNDVQMDQPFSQAATVLGGPGAGNDRAYVGFNFYSQRLNGGGNGRTASVYLSLNAATSMPPAGFAVRTIEARNTGTGICGQDGPQVRPAIHPDGTIYALFYGWRCNGGNFPAITTDVVITRDDSWGTGATPFTALVEPSPGDGLAGVRIVQGVTFTWNGMLGQERLGGDLAIAVDPRNSSTVYIVWADLQTSVYTLHLRRSTDRGVTWSGDLLTVANGKNPSLAINTMGKIAFLYQQVTGTGTSQRWDTHVRRSTNGTTWDDVTLATVPSGTPASTFLPYIGDYAQILAAGKNFYGVFSANNTPTNANFPNGVTYQRNANFGTGTLLDLSSNPVSASIDPFFFRLTEVPAADDFYVRDWTDSPTSGDTGLEPSTHPVFYSTSDVWNRRGTQPGSFPNDQPENEDAGNGNGNIGHNWAFARVRRNALPASGSKTVTAHFLVSKLGTGSNYVDAGSVDPDVTFPDPDPTLTFAAGDLGPLTTDAYKWRLKAVTSTHLCLAVEISVPGDPFVAPSLVGNTPGWWTGTDLRVLNDNNKAQRNMGLSTTPAKGVGQSVSFFAIAHNGATFTRDIVLRYEVPPAVRRRLGAASIDIVGVGRRPFRSGSTIRLPRVRPAENRWVGVTFVPPVGRAGELVPVNFSELVGDTPINGFSIGARLADTAAAARDALHLHRSVLTRLADGFGFKEAEAQAEAALKLVEAKEVDANEYLRFLRARSGGLRAIVQRLYKREQAADPFAALETFKPLDEAIGRRSSEDATVVHAALLNRLDSYLTMRQLAQGDVADILQNVRWQADLYRRTRQLSGVTCTPSLLEASNQFIAAYGERKVGNKDYPELIRSLLKCFRETAATPSGTRLRLGVDVTAMERSGDDLVRLQKAHREFLLKLDGLASR
jgi:hypothetical protein